jgi:hypothetical protein
MTPRRSQIDATRLLLVAGVVDISDASSDQQK